MLVEASGGTSRSISSFRSRTPPGSYSINPIAAVEWATNTFTMPSSAPLVWTTSCTPRVMSMMSPSPSVDTRIWALWTGIAQTPYRRASPLGDQVMKSATSQGLPGAITSRKRSSSAGSIE